MNISTRTMITMSTFHEVDGEGTLEGQALGRDEIKLTVKDRNGEATIHGVSLRDLERFIAVARRDQALKAGYVS